MVNWWLSPDPAARARAAWPFDTIFAEGRRQYLESLSTYARQFVQQLERPDVDLVDGLQPVICVDQTPGASNPRSTVATATEMHHYVRLLLARLGDVACHACGAEVRQQSPAEIQRRLLELPEGCKLMLLAPMVRGRKGRHADVLDKIRKAGLVRARIDGQVFDLEHPPSMNARAPHDVEAVIDRIIIRERISERLEESLQLALKLGDGVVIACRWDPDAATSDGERGAWLDEHYNTRYACGACGASVLEIEPRTFSFSSPYGACESCDGLGRIGGFDPELFAPRLELSLDKGAVVAWNKRSTRTCLKKLAPLLELHKIATDQPLSQLTPDQRDALWNGDAQRPGVRTLLEKEYATCTDEERLDALRSYRGATTCAACGGARLRPAALAVRIGGWNIAEISGLAVNRAHAFFDSIDVPDSQRAVGDPLIREILARLAFLQHVGLGYLTLDRPVDSLSGGERQRVRLANCIGSGLAGVCYILDEPSIGLHPHDNQRLIDSLQSLKQQSATVIVVEHDEDTMRAADHMIDLGPAAGRNGGAVLATGSPEEIAANPASVTGPYLAGTKRVRWPGRRRSPNHEHTLRLIGASGNNLSHVTFEAPLQRMTCVTGVSGSGKSTLVMQTLAPAVARALGMGGPRPAAFEALEGVEHLDKLVLVDQSPIGRSPRGNPATYSGAMAEIRKVFAATREAKLRGYKAGRFSFNVKGGRCENCQGQGMRRVAMHFLPDMFVRCEDCRGRRFNRATLQARFKGKSIAEVLSMSIDEAQDFFESFASLHRTLRSLADVGLGYLRLGQSSTTLSGGEAQRVKLATELARPASDRTLYILDEPTTGLHFVDVQRLLEILQRLVERGDTVVLIEHDMDLARAADWVVDLGPGGGEDGGRIVAFGAPETVMACAESRTGRWLAQRP